MYDTTKNKWLTSVEIIWHVEQQNWIIQSED